MPETIISTKRVKTIPIKLPVINPAIKLLMKYPRLYRDKITLHRFRVNQLDLQIVQLDSHRAARMISSEVVCSTRIPANKMLPQTVKSRLRNGLLHPGGWS
jgi:hypothetical protein